MKFENTLITEISSLISGGCKEFYSGMAMGFDIIAAETVLLLKNANPDLELKLYCVLPFRAQSDSFTPIWKERFDNVLKQCDRIFLVAEEYSQGCYQRRNRFLVDNSDYVMTWFDGRAGGTKNTLEYAVKKQRFVININKNPDISFAVQTSFEII